jgi:hypothetical protein
MAIDPVSAGLGAVSLISGKNANKKAESQAKSAQKSAKKWEDRAAQLWKVMFEGADKAVKEGLFDPDRKIAQLEKDTANYEAKDLGNLSGALTTAGYKPGDSEIGVRLDAVKGKYRQYLDKMREDIRTSSFFDQQNAYATANPNYLQPAIQGGYNRAGMAMGQMQDPSQFLGAFFKGLTPKKSGLTAPSSDNPFWR